jgi:hypothetical protein
MLPRVMLSGSVLEGNSRPSKNVESSVVCPHIVKSSKRPLPHAFIFTHYNNQRNLQPVLWSSIRFANIIAIQIVTKFVASMERKGSFLCSQDPSSGPYPEPPRKPSQTPCVIYASSLC